MLDDFKKGICMIIDDAFDALAASCQYYQISFFGACNNIFHLVFFVLEPGAICWAARQIFHKEIRSHHLGCEVAANYLRPSLLDEQDPNLVSNGLAE